MNEITRTRKDAQKLKDIIQYDLENLPEYNTFGESNSEEANELILLMYELDEFIKKGRLPKNEGSEVFQWLTSNYSFLDNVYGELIH